MKLFSEVRPDLERLYRILGGVGSKDARLVRYCVEKIEAMEKQAEADKEKISELLGRLYP